MRLIQTIKLALKNIKTNKMRSALTMIGIIIGISSVIIMVSIGNGSSKDIMSQVQSLGTNLISVNVMSKDGISADDMEQLKKINGVKDLTPSMGTSAKIKFDRTSSNYSITGVKENFANIRQLKLANGRFISDIDDENKSKVLVIGDNVATELFGYTNVVGQYVKVNGESYRVIGVLEKQGSSMGGNIDDMVMAPLSTTELLAKSKTISSLYVQATSENAVDSTASILDMYFTNKLKSDGNKTHSVMSQKQLLDTMGSITQTLSMLLGSIAGISLIVGGIGVMNVMLVSVTERTKEIGIRKALGGKRKDIMTQFLIEALVLSLIGGLLGITLGVGGVLLVSKFGIKIALSTNIILISLSFSMLIGIIFGIFPAYKASNLKPIDALRYE